MPRTPAPTMPYLVTRGPDGTVETAVARFVLLDDARNYVDWRAARNGAVFRARHSYRPGTIHSAGPGTDGATGGGGLAE